MATALHSCIEKHNVLHAPTVSISTFLHAHPPLYKLALLINHLFRAIAMTALMIYLPFSFAANTVLCFVGSLFYRLTVETNCAYKFALPSFGGSLALVAAKRALACSSLFYSCALVTPLILYVTYIALTVSYDVDERCN